ncbi:hypothetical protein ACJX0J_022254, partial [Zea mays]
LKIQRHINHECAKVIIAMTIFNLVTNSFQTTIFNLFLVLTFFELNQCLLCNLLFLLNFDICLFSSICISSILNSGL